MHETLEFEVAGHTYRAGRMDAMTAFHVMRRLTPVLASFREMGQANDMFAALEPVARAVAGMSDADSELVLGACLSVCERRQDGGRGWARIWSVEAKRPMFDDIDIAAMLQVAFHVIQGALGPFFPGLPLASTGADQA